MSAKPKSPTWIKTEQDAQKKRDEERLKDRIEQLKQQGFLHKPFTAPQGETIIRVDTSIEPKFNEKGKFGTQAILEADINNERYSWGINLKSPLWKQLLDVLAQGINPITLIRAGTGQSTRYSIKEAKA